MFSIHCMLNAIWVVCFPWRLNIRIYIWLSIDFTVYILWVSNAVWYITSYAAMYRISLSFLREWCLWSVLVIMLCSRQNRSILDGTNSPVLSVGSMKSDRRSEFFFYQSMFVIPCPYRACVCRRVLKETSSRSTWLIVVSISPKMFGCVCLTET